MIILTDLTTILRSTIFVSLFLPISSFSAIAMDPWIPGGDEADVPPAAEFGAADARLVDAPADLGGEEEELQRAQAAMEAAQSQAVQPYATLASAEEALFLAKLALSRASNQNEREEAVQEQWEKAFDAVESAKADVERANVAVTEAKGKLAPLARRKYLQSEDYQKRMEAERRERAVVLEAERNGLPPPLTYFEKQPEPKQQP